MAKGVAIDRLLLQSAITLTTERLDEFFNGWLRFVYEARTAAVTAAAGLAGEEPFAGRPAAVAAEFVVVAGVAVEAAQES
jgi:hypothetical protein